MKLRESRAMTSNAGPAGPARTQARHRGELPPGVTDVASLEQALRDHQYLADDGLATAIFLSLRLARPLLLEGEAGVGKTEVAKTLADLYGSELIRLQCYEGIDVAQAVYEWAYARQLLHIRALEATGDATKAEADVYSEQFLVRRPLLRAISPDPGTARPDGARPVLLIDEVDRADDEFEAFLLEVLADYSVTIPELGTFRALEPPAVVITSNRTREVHDALKRRCLYHWIELPDFEREVEIITLRLPDVEGRLARQVTALVQQLRELPLYKPPGVAETLDWAEALWTLGAGPLDADRLDTTLGSVLKYKEDHERVRARGLGDLVREAVRRAG
jgi:MoxR-like ATPase